MTKPLSIEPAPSAAEAVALASAVAAVLEEEGAHAIDPLPRAYRSAWRIAGLKEGVVRMPDGGWPAGAA